MSYSKILTGLAAGLLAADLALAVAPAQCPEATGCRASAGAYPEWAYVVYPEASHIVYPEGIFVFGDR